MTMALLVAVRIRRRRRMPATAALHCGARTRVKSRMQDVAGAKVSPPCPALPFPLHMRQLALLRSPEMNKTSRALAEKATGGRSLTDRLVSEQAAKQVIVVLLAPLAWCSLLGAAASCSRPARASLNRAHRGLSHTSRL
jgi:hypothetical protein